MPELEKFFFRGVEMLCCAEVEEPEDKIYFPWWMLKLMAIRDMLTLFVAVWAFISLLLTYRWLSWMFAVEEEDDR